MRYRPTGMRIGSSDNTPTNYFFSLLEMSSSFDPVIVRIFLIKFAMIRFNKDTPFSDKWWNNTDHIFSADVHFP